MKRVIAQHGASCADPVTLTTLVKQFLGLERPERGSWIETFMQESAEKRAGQQQAVQQFTAQEI